jgi:zinc protease
VRRAFGRWQAGSAPAKNIAASTTQNVGKIYLMDRPGAPQSVIVAGHLSLEGGRPNDLALETLIRNFGGISTSRLNRNLRLDKHWSYGVQGVIQRARGQRPFLVVAPVQTDKTRESMLEVRQEILGVAGARPVRGEEFQSIHRNMMLSLPGRYETLAALEGAALDLVTQRYPESYFTGYGANLRRLTEADLESAGREAVRPDQVVWLVVGDLAQIEPGIRQLGWGEVIRLDANGRPQQ